MLIGHASPTPLAGCAEREWLFLFKWATRYNRAPEFSNFAGVMA
jgi:hypothetical protein